EDGRRRKRRVQYRRELVMKINQIAPKLRPRISQRELARVLEVTPRTIRNWEKRRTPESFPKLGRPAHDERAHGKAFWRVGREYLRQAKCGWRGIHHALGDLVPIRLVQQYTRVFKSCEKHHERRRILPRRKRIEVLASNALWVQDATRIGREESGAWIESEIIKDRGSFTLLGITTGKSAESEEHTSELQSRENLVCRLLLEKKKK